MVRHDTASQPNCKTMHISRGGTMRKFGIAAVIVAVGWVAYNAITSDPAGTAQSTKGAVQTAAHAGSQVGTFLSDLGTTGVIILVVGGLIWAISRKVK